MTVNLGAGHDSVVVDPNMHNLIVVHNGIGHDTLQYQYSDAAHDPGPAGDGSADSAATASGKVVIGHFVKALDFLNFDDTGADALTKTEVNAFAKVHDGGLHHAVTIVIDTSAGAAAGTIVLQGVGTLHHSLTSIDALVAHHFHLTFS